MITALLLIGMLGALLLSAFSSGAETGIYCLDRVRLRVAGERGEAAALRLEKLLRAPEDVVITALIGTNIADYLTTAFVTALFLNAAYAASLAEVYATAVVTPLILVFGGIIPKDWFRRESNRLLSQVSWLLLMCLYAARATGIVWALRSLTRALMRWIDPRHAPVERDVLSRAHTLHLLREGATRGGLTTLQRALIERVLNLSGVRVANVMVPLGRAAVVPVDLRREDFLRAVRMAHFSRWPVYRGRPREFVGVIYAFDVLTDRESRPLEAHIRPPFFVTDRESVSSALLRMQRAREAMAIVRDHSGACVGLLTLKDLVEEIVGDLEAW